MEICSRPEPGDYQWKIKSEWIYYLGKLKATSQALFNLILNSRKILKFQILISSVVPLLLQSCNMSTNVIETHFILNIKFYSKYLYLIFNKHLMLDIEKWIKNNGYIILYFWIAQLQKILDQKSYSNTYFTF